MVPFNIAYIGLRQTLKTSGQLLILEGSTVIIQGNSHTPMFIVGKYHC